MNRKIATGLICVAICICVSANETQDLLDDAKVFLNKHGTDLTLWPVSDLEYNGSVLKKYLAEIDSITDAKDLHRYRIRNMGNLQVHPLLLIQVNEAYFLKKSEVVDNLDEYENWSSQDDLNIGFLLVAYSPKMNKENAIAKLRSLGVNRKQVLQVESTFIDPMLKEWATIVEKVDQGYRKWNFRELEQMSSISNYRPGIRNYLTEYYIESLSTAPTKGELWAGLAQHVERQKAYSGQDLVSRLQNKVAITLPKTSEHYYLVNALANRQRTFSKKANELIESGLLVLSNGSAADIEEDNAARSYLGNTNKPTAHNADVSGATTEGAQVAPNSIYSSNEDTDRSRWFYIAGFSAILLGGAVLLRLRKR